MTSSTEETGGRDEETGQDEDTVDNVVVTVTVAVETDVREDEGILEVFDVSLICSRGVNRARFLSQKREWRESQIVYEHRAHNSDTCLQIRVMEE